MLGGGDDDFDLTKYVLRLSKKIVQITKDYVGLPFSSDAGQLPFSIDHRPPSRSRFFSTSRKWQRGDPLIGFYTLNAGQRKMVLNLPDGSTLLDLCYPGWEVALLEEQAMDHFFSKRYLFGDYYGHLLNGKPLQKTREQPQESPVSEASQALANRRAEVFNRRRTSLENAAENQQRRGVPFDAPLARTDLKTDHTSQITRSSTSLVGTDGSGLPRTLQKITVASQSVRDSISGTDRNRLVIQKTYNTGEVETTEQNKQVILEGPLDCNLEQILASQLFNVFGNSDKTSTPTEQDPPVSSGGATDESA